MASKTVFFDLDGTLTDSGEGIINCVTVTFQHFAMPVPERDALRVFVGPPLRDSFLKFGVPADRIEEAIRVYRARYNTIGKYENFPYPGITALLDALKSRGYRLFVATSKPEAMAIDILEHFDLAHYFEIICGATADGIRDRKADVIAWLLSQTAGIEETVMVGDTAYDVIGAAEHGIPTVGVAWGYGSVPEMEKAGAVAIARSPQELLTLL